jgi:hypothetical protein
MLRTTLRHRPSPAMLVALLSLFVALGGSAGALVVVTSQNIANGSIRGKDIHKRTITAKRIKSNALGGSVIDESKLSKVPAAVHADDADTAKTAGSAGTAGQADVADSLLAPEPYRVVGAPGQPKLGDGCANSPDSAEQAAFFKDREGVVHLKGNVICEASNTLFQLPEGYRPATGEQLQYPEPSDNFLNIFGPGVTGVSSGAVQCLAPPGLVSGCWLDGVTFRAAS